MGELNTGDPQTLSDFAIWAIANYPAYHYIIVLMDHGGSWKGVCRDDHSGGDLLTMSELTTAFNTIVSNTGVKLDIIGFDACLMGSIEVAYQIRNYANIMVGSEHFEYSPGWTYSSILSNLTMNPSMSPTELATIIVGEYGEFYNGGPYYDETLSAVNLSLMDPLAKYGVDRLARALWYALPDSRQLINSYINDAQPFDYDEDRHWDLHHFANVTQQNCLSFPNPKSINESCETIMEYVEAAVIAEWHDEPYATNAHGLSFFFPRPEWYRISYSEIDLSRTYRWDDFLSEHLWGGHKRWYFHKEMDPSVQGYKQLKVDVPCETLEEIVKAPGLAEHVLVGKWVTQPLPSQTIPSGTWTFHLWCYRETRAYLWVYAKIYKQHDSTQTLLATTNQAVIPFLAYGETNVTASFPETQMAQGDKIIVEVWFYGQIEGRIGPKGCLAYDTTNRNSRIDTTSVRMDILFYDSFEADLRQWQIITPTWQIENGELSGNGTIYTEPPEIEAKNLWINDFDLQLRFCRKTTWTYFNVVFRYTSSAQYRVRIYQNQIRAELAQSGSVTVLNSSTVDWDTDVWHSLQIIASGNSFTVYYNGSLKLKAVDPNSTISGGGFRLDVGHNQGGGPQRLHAHFDDILMRYC